jgi:AcrR family transcriptional regulator
MKGPAMPPKAGKKDESRARILQGAGRGFRRLGYGGVGVDGLAREAGVTSGAFYGHFASKAEAFRETVVAGMVALREALSRLHASAGPAWREGLTEAYLTVRMDCPIDESCVLQNLTGEVARSDAATREAYGKELDALFAAAGNGTHRAEAIALLALLTGAVSMGRAVNDPALRAEIIAATRQAAKALAPDA